MAQIDITRRHGLGLAGARRAAEEVAARLRAEYGVAADAWEGDTLRVAGRGVKGTLTATADAIHVTASLPLHYRPLRRAFTAEIERELDRYAG